MTGNLTAASWLTNTALTTACTACATPVTAPPIAQPDHTALQALKSAATTIPAGAAAAAMATWDPNKVPCSEFDPLCAPCTLLTAAASCGAAAPSDPLTPTLPRWYCNYQGVTCREGRVTGVDLTGLGIGFGSVPAGVLLLERAETICELLLLLLEWGEVSVRQEGGEVGDLRACSQHT